MKRRLLLKTIVGVVGLGAVLVVAALVLGPGFLQVWVTEEELHLAGRGCPSSLGAISVEPLEGLVLSPISLCISEGHGTLLRAERAVLAPDFGAFMEGGQRPLVWLTLSDVVIDGESVRQLAHGGTGSNAFAQAGIEAAPRRWPAFRVQGVRVLDRGHTFGGPEWRVEGKPDASIGWARVLRSDRELGTVHWQRTGQELGFDALLNLAPLAQWTQTPFVKEGELRMALRVPLECSRTQGHAELSLEAREVVLEGEPLASRPVGPWGYGLDAAVEWRDGGVSMHRLVARVGPDHIAFAQGEGSLKLEEPRPFTLMLQSAETPFSSLLAALPIELQPPPDVPRLDAPLNASLKVQGTMREPEAWHVESVLGLEGLRKVASSVPWNIRGAFTHTPTVGAHPGTRQVVVGPKNPAYVSLSDLPEHVWRSVTLAEDAGFFGHQGFDFAELRQILLDPSERRRGRGASTLTQQLAKNLYSAGERTYVRKLREALTTVTLEAALSKSRILELYLNLIEWGPDVYGLGEAAKHYFNVEPRALTPKQAVFLATLIPNPTRYHAYFTRGALTERWDERVNELLDKLKDTGVISEEAYEGARSAPLNFEPQGTPVRTTW